MGISVDGRNYEDGGRRGKTRSRGRTCKFGETGVTASRA